MKPTTLIISLLLMACTSKNSITPTTGIIGKWSPTYITQTKNSDGTWEPFHKINTFVALPVYEFTADGRFLRDGKDGATVCFSGSKYKVSADNKITFTERHPSEILVDCLPCENWAIIEIKNDTLILEECARVRNKFVRQK
jgi:hypothetical protein